MLTYATIYLPNRWALRCRSVSGDTSRCRVCYIRVLVLLSAVYVSSYLTLLLDLCREILLGVDSAMYVSSYRILLSSVYVSSYLILLSAIYVSSFLILLSLCRCTSYYYLLYKCPHTSNYYLPYTCPRSSYFCLCVRMLGAPRIADTHSYIYAS